MTAQFAAEMAPAAAPDRDNQPITAEAEYASRRGPETQLLEVSS
jgi:hypothetical protein